MPAGMHSRLALTMPTFHYPSRKQFLPVRGTRMVLPVKPRSFKSVVIPNGKPTKRQQSAPVASEIVPKQVESPKGITGLWVTLGNGLNAHWVELAAPEKSLCGRSMVSAKPYGGSKFCKRCFEMKGANAKGL